MEDLDRALELEKKRMLEAVKTNNQDEFFKSSNYSRLFELTKQAVNNKLAFVCSAPECIEMQDATKRLFLIIDDLKQQIIKMNQ